MTLFFGWVGRPSLWNLFFNFVCSDTSLVHIVVSLARLRSTSGCPQDQQDAAAAQQASRCQTAHNCQHPRTVKVQKKIKSQIFHCRKQCVLGGGHAILRIRGNWTKIRRGLKYSDNLRKAPRVVWPCTQLDVEMISFERNIIKIWKKYWPKEEQIQRDS